MCSKQGRQRQTPISSINSTPQRSVSSMWFKFVSDHRQLIFSMGHTCVNYFQFLVCMQGNTSLRNPSLWYVTGSKQRYECISVLSGSFWQVNSLMVGRFNVFIGTSLASPLLLCRILSSGFQRPYPLCIVWCNVEFFEFQSGSPTTNLGRTLLLVIYWLWLLWPRSFLN